MIEHSNHMWARLFGRLLFVCWCVTLTAGSAPSQSAVIKPITIEPGTQIERELKGGEAEVFGIHLSSGQFLHLVVDQNGIDVAVNLLNPEGQSLVALDGPSGRFGPEDIAVITESTGEYKLEVRSPEKSALGGRFKVTIV